MIWVRSTGCPPAIATDAIWRWLGHVPDTVDIGWPLAAHLNDDDPPQVQIVTTAPGVMWFVTPDEAERVRILHCGDVECTRWKRGMEIAHDVLAG